MNDNSPTTGDTLDIDRATLIIGSVTALRDLLIALPPGMMLPAEQLSCLVSLIVEAGEHSHG